jgi:integrase
MTLAQLVSVYQERYVDVHRAATADAYRWQLGAIATTELPTPTGAVVAFGAWRLSDIVTDTVERFREVRRRRTGTAGVNRMLANLRAVYSWAIRTGYVESSPFKRNGETAVRLEPETSRARRLQAGEEEAILAAAIPAVHALVTTAIETGMRRGEILSLQWSQVEGLTVDGKTLKWSSRAALFLPAAKTKTRRDRRIPVSTRLRAVLEMRRFDPADQALPADAYVFGNALGKQADGFRRVWATTLLRAHGHHPRRTPTGQLDRVSRAHLRAIDLHFHDLRREAGSRWLEGGVPVHTVRDWLGHTSIAQTSTYLASTMATAHDAMAKFDLGRNQLRPEPAGRRGHDGSPMATRIVN